MKETNANENPWDAAPTIKGKGEGDSVFANYFSIYPEASLGHELEGF